MSSQHIKIRVVIFISNLIFIFFLSKLFSDFMDL